VISEGDTSQLHCALHDTSATVDTFYSFEVALDVTIASPVVFGNDNMMVRSTLSRVTSSTDCTVLATSSTVGQVTSGVGSCVASELPPLAERAQRFTQVQLAVPFAVALAAAEFLTLFGADLASSLNVDASNVRPICMRASATQETIVMYDIVLLDMAGPDAFFIVGDNEDAVTRQAPRMYTDTRHNEIFVTLFTQLVDGSFESGTLSALYAANSIPVPPSFLATDSDTDPVQLACANSEQFTSDSCTTTAASSSSSSSLLWLWIVLACAAAVLCIGYSVIRNRAAQRSKRKAADEVFDNIAETAAVDVAAPQTSVWASDDNVPVASSVWSVQ
jgi:hypothetical protein